jgi:hypothetical protein
MDDNSIPPESTDRTDALPAVTEGAPFAFQTQPHGVTGSTRDLYEELRGELDRPILDREQAPYVSGTIDVSQFVKALARFNLEQALFLREGRKEPKEDYLRMLSRYSLAQDDYIRAMSTVLHELGVI